MSLEEGWMNPPPPGVSDDNSNHSHSHSRERHVSLDKHDSKRDVRRYSAERGRHERAAHRSRSRSKERFPKHSRHRRSRSRDRRYRSRSGSRKRHSDRRYRKSHRRHSRSRSRSRTKHHRKSYSRSRSPSSSRSRSYSSSSTSDRDTHSRHSKTDKKDNKPVEETEYDDPVQENTFKNDGSFLEMFKKMQEQAKTEVKQEQSDAGPSEVKKIPIFGKRRGGRILKTGVVQKVKSSKELDEEPKDAWSVYMKEVRKYKEACCDDDSKTRPLVK